jgi:hypothetical protein
MARDLGDPKLTVVQNKANYGIYVWRLPSGGLVTDGNGNVMNIPGRSHDFDCISKITKAANYYGFPEGKPEFQAGIRRITDEEHSEQTQRMKEGYIPSETDIGAWADAARGLRRHGND